MTKYEIAANAEIAAITGRWIKLTAGQQKDIFGGYLFGKQSIWVDLQGQGEIIVHRTCAFGTDGFTERHSLQAVAEAANAGKSLRCR